eukprot:jgi/Tetstr1/455987/TSEL_042766.t2
MSALLANSAGGPPLRSRPGTRTRRAAAVRVSCAGGGGEPGQRRGEEGRFPRRAGLLAAVVMAVAPPAARVSAAEEVDTTVTAKAVIELGICPNGFNQQRGLGESSLCANQDPLGRLVIGLYGNAVPRTVANFSAAAAAGAYNGTLIHKILPGAYVLAGKQGPARLGGVTAPRDVPPNTELTTASAFKLEHFYPGTVSLPLGANDDDDRLRLRPGYANLEFLITTGPGPVPSLDGENVVFGRVIEGLGTLSALADVPTFYPPERSRMLNNVAKVIGDDRAAKAQSNWGRPLKPVVIQSVTIVEA